ncbi:aldo/keto reductase [Sphingomonas sp. PB2P12]|uniref:aldo/keto reductase n=1 Tax=Sphingomonas sandaracina TaxID=3096157 RepID=UPI002FC99473
MQPATAPHRIFESSTCRCQWRVPGKSRSASRRRRSILPTCGSSPASIRICFRSSFPTYSPLGRGFLTGQSKSPDDLDQSDSRRNHPRFQGDAFQKNLDLVAAIAAMASDKGCAPAQLALAWVLAQGKDIVPIPGTKRRKYLEDNLGALDVALSDADLARIDEVLPPGAAQGTRYPQTSMASIDQ